MDILRLTIDLAYYWNKIYCECVCHEDFFTEMKGKPCLGCMLHGCEWMRSNPSYSPWLASVQRGTMKISCEEQEVGRTNGQTLTGAAK